MYPHFPAWAIVLAYSLLGGMFVAASVIAAIELVELVQAMRRWWRRDRWV
jgi:hypothetical protein